MTEAIEPPTTFPTERSRTSAVGGIQAREPAPEKAEKAFAEPLHVGRPNIGCSETVMGYIREALDRRWLTNRGPLVQEFERRISEFAGVKHCIAMSNATVALEIAVRALGICGEVIVPAYTFVATAHALEWQQIKPVFCDIHPATHNLDPAHVEACITPKTTAILGVHLWGRSCDVEALEAIASRHGLKLIFDAAHAFGCSHHGRMIGRFGLAEVFSFHATKFVSCGEGGAVVTNDDQLAHKIRLMQNFGFSGYDNVVSVGTNGKMSELSAAFGLASLESMDSFLQVNRRNHAAYREALRGLPGIRLLEYSESERNNCQYVVLDIDDRESSLTRDQLLQVLHAENVLARRYFYPGVHKMEPYRTRYPDVDGRLPVTEAVAGRVLVLPTGTAVGGAEIRTIGQIIAAALTSSESVRRQFPATLAISE